LSARVSTHIALERANGGRTEGKEAGVQGSASVLLVDDREENLIALEAVLEPLGLHCVRARSGFEGLSELLRRDFALILLDVQMPGMDGFETAAMIRRRGRTREVPIIFVTAHEGSDTSVARGYELGAVDYVTKPFEPRTLRSKVSALVDLYRKDAALRDSEARFRAAFEHAPIGIALVDIDGRWLKANRSLAEIVRRPAGSLLDEPPFDVRRLADDLFEELVGGWRKSFSVDRRLVAGDGGTVWATISVSLVRDRHGDPLHLVCQVEDVTQRKESEEQLSRVVEQFERALDAARDAVFILDGRTLELTYANQGAVAQTGFAADELMTMSAPDLSVDFEEAAYRDMVRPLVRGELDSGSFVTNHRRRDGSAVPVEITLQAITSPGRARRIVAVARDISERREAEERIAYLAYHDDLTALPNRAMLREHLDLALARADRRGAAVAVLYLDLNRFKLVNDSLGHAAGDDLLREAAARLRSAVRASDLLARVGGDEFLVLLSDLDAAAAPDIAQTVAASIHRTLERAFVISGAEFYVGTSVGVGLYMPGEAKAGGGADALLDQADAAMYQAKHAGLPTAVYTTPVAAPIERLELTTRLRKAVESSDLVLHWMPMVNLVEERVCGVEALMRWRDPEHGWIMPSELLTLAEEAGVIDELGAWAMREAATQQASWHEAGLDLDVAVNVSSRQLLKVEAADQILRTIAETGANARRMVVEIGEVAAAKTPDHVRELVTRLRRVGLKIAIDDFAHSSLATLRGMDLDWLKIDNRLIAESGRPDGETMLRAIVQLARNLGMRPLAEGIETRDQFELLKRLGCSFGQGHFFGRPLPADDVPEFVERFAVTPVFDPWVAWEASRVTEHVGA
jgi:diguanylate cyclase (GGDEF)-like protein/PAS domain S-box-containing protein